MGMCTLHKVFLLFFGDTITTQIWKIMGETFYKIVNKESMEVV
jgi:hypothetical protein